MHFSNVFIMQFVLLCELHIPVLPKNIYFRYLANIFEEGENSIYESFSWALRENGRKLFTNFSKLKGQPWHGINYRAIISKPCYEEVKFKRKQHFYCA